MVTNVFAMPQYRSPIGSFCPAKLRSNSGVNAFTQPSRYILRQGVFFSRSETASGGGTPGAVRAMALPEVSRRESERLLAPPCMTFAWRREHEHLPPAHGEKSETAFHQCALHACRSDRILRINSFACPSSGENASIRPRAPNAASFLPRLHSTMARFIPALNCTGSF
jgi:hypothetical protein